MKFDILVHPSTQSAILKFIERPSHALLIEGSTGSGKSNVALAVAQKLLNKNNIENNSGFLHISPDKNTISIDQIRQAQKFTKLKSTGVNQINRVLWVEITNHITIEAQNAFLKLLEEPPVDTVILVTISSAKSLLPTITSRTQLITVLPVNLSDALDKYSDNEYSREQIVTAYNLSEGKSANLHNIIVDVSETLNLINDTKSYLGSDVFERLIKSSELSKDKSQVESVLKNINLISRAALKSSITNSSSTQSKRWLNMSKTAVKLEDYMNKNANTKLIATYLALHI